VRHRYSATISRDRICKRLRSSGIDSKESICLPAYVAWRAGTLNRVFLPARQAGNRVLGSFKGLQIRAPQGISHTDMDGHNFRYDSTTGGYGYSTTQEPGYLYSPDSYGSGGYGSDGYRSGGYGSAGYGSGG
jgi:hypothetical protein